jgi:3-hydroxyisobutyrate dehydrogenase-like beta-hydroxyacid dehydrogenase
MRISVFGMGNMGRALALRLLERGHAVTVWNRTPGKASEVVDAGATEAPSPPEAARGAEAVLLSLADDQAVRDVMTRLADLGSDPGGPVVVDMSTVSPDTSRALVDLAPGGGFVAAPIVGGPQAVVAGQAVGLVGGERDLVDRLKPIWSDAFTARWYYCGGDPGGALTYKLLNNYLLMSGIAVLAEVVATGQAAELDEAILRDFLFEWPTIAPALHNRLDDLIGGDHRGWFTTPLGAKDVRLLAEVAESRGLDLPIARLVERRYEEAAGRGWSDSDITAVVELLREQRR